MTLRTEQRAGVSGGLMETFAALGAIVADGSVKAADRIRAAREQRGIAELIDAQAASEARRRSRASGFTWVD